MTGIFEAVDVASEIINPQFIDSATPDLDVMSSGTFNYVDFRLMGYKNINLEPIGNLAADKVSARWGAANVANFNAIRGATSPSVFQEITRSGGIHGVPNPAATGLYSSLTFFLNAAETLVRANTASQIYSDIWIRPTRKIITAPGGNADLFFAGVAGSRSTFGTNNDANATENVRLHPSASSTILSKFSGSPDTVAQAVMMASAGAIGAKPDTQTYNPKGINWRTHIADGTGGMAYIIYGWYFEDLTYSGRSATEVYELRNACFQRAFSLGGQFYDDEWTSPGSIVF